MGKSFLNNPHPTVVESRKIYIYLLGEPYQNQELVNRHWRITQRGMYSDRVTSCQSTYSD